MADSTQESTPKEDRAPRSRVSDPALSHPRELSLAEQERRSSHTWRIVVYVIALIAALSAPYGLGRYLAMNRTETILDTITRVTPQGMALLGWSVTVIALLILAMAVLESHNILWRILFLVALAGEQFLAGMALLRLNFWTATYVIYGKASLGMNALNIGIIAAGAALAVFAVLYVGMLVIIKKDSKINILTRSWSAMTLFFVIEVLALLVAMFGILPIFMQ